MAIPNSASPSPFTPPRTPDDPTVSHLLNLPPLLHPISPSLAALHMARVRLLLDIPSSSSVGVMSEWWCHACGGLREGLGGAQRPRARKRPGLPGGGKRSSSSRTGGKAALAPSATLAGGAKRKAAECANCGAKFTKAKPDRDTLITYPSARIAARRRKEQEQQEPGTDPFVVQERVQTASSKAIGMDIDTDLDSPTPVPSTPSTSALGQRAAMSQDTVPSMAIDKKPSFARVRVTEPNLPTYPQPQASTSPEKPKKRKKKSGLAKLLAENKERAAAQNLGGTWGLG